MVSAPVLEVTRVSYEKSGHYILNDITFSLRHGEFAGIIGPNGAGKSTLLQVIVGEIQRYTGTVRFYGKIGYVPQRRDFQRDFPIKAREVVAMGLYRRRGLSRFFSRKDWEECRRLLERVGIGELSEESVAFFSGGEYQRLLLARAIAYNPDILILDEPEAGVDEMGKASFYELLSQWRKERQRSVLLVSHDIGLVLNACDTIMCLNKSLHCHKDSSMVSSEDLRSVYTEDYDILIKGKQHFEKEHLR
jgi:zinc transport system ATP-binding protein